MSLYTSYSYVGGEPPKNGSLIEWSLKVKDYPMPIKIKLLDLGYLFDFVNGVDPVFAKQSFYHALDIYCKTYTC
jgi:hypothetical protein